MLNPFFLQGSKTEQGLVQDLINEQLKIYGIDVYYLPRQYITEKTVIKEVIQSEFNYAYPIEAYIDSYEGYGGQGTILSKFGIQELDDLNLIISRERYDTYIRELIKDLPDVKLSSRPKEGDLIYFPLGNRIFEIKYVEHEKPFYQLKKNYVYELRCELFRYEDEVINTGIEFIDNPDSGGSDGDGTGDDVTDREQFASTQKLQLIGIGSTASAIASIVNGGVRFITITDRGSGYSSPPVVAFSSAPFGGGTAVGIATMISGIVDLCEPNKTLLRIQGVQLTNPGYGYTVAPRVNFIGGGGNGAIATATIGNGIVGVITVTSGGSGYSYSPSVTFVGIASTSAQASTIISESGSVTQIRIINAGLGYTQAPQIQISPPNIIVGFGTYQYNEIVSGNISGVTARVKSWNVPTKILEVSNLSGTFSSGEILVGQTSGASYSLQRKSTSGVDNPATNPNNRFGQNDTIQDEADDVLDFSEINPFGTP
jgi:hypothetical protein